MLSTFCLGKNATMETRDYRVFSQDEANITMVSYVIQAAYYVKHAVRVVSDDTDVFVLLAYWIHRAALQYKARMERWNGTVLDINATCTELGSKGLHLLGVHALSGCDMTSYLYGIGKTRSLNTLLYQKIFHV